MDGKNMETWGPSCRVSVNSTRGKFSDANTWSVRINTNCVMRRDGTFMSSLVITITVCAIFTGMAFLILIMVWREVLWIYRNPFPLFNNNVEKRFSEIPKYATSILEDVKELEATV